MRLRDPMRKTIANATVRTSTARGDASRRRPWARRPRRPRSSSSSKPSSSLNAPPKLAVSSGAASVEGSSARGDQAPRAASKPWCASVATKIRARVAPRVCRLRIDRSETVRSALTRFRAARSSLRSRNQTRHDSRISTARSASPPVTEMMISSRLRTASMASVMVRWNSPQQMMMVRSSFRRRRRLKVGAACSPSGTVSEIAPAANRSAWATTA